MAQMERNTKSIEERLSGNQIDPDQLRQLRRMVDQTTSIIVEQLRKGATVREADQSEVQDYFVDFEEDFRVMTVIPKTADIKGTGDPYVRENLISRKYKNVDHYLDVQYRLLREDMVRPLRIQINELLHNNSGPSDDKWKTITRVYEQVRVLYPCFAYDSFVFKVSFDVTRLKNVKWETSKRLKFGSLVCLSPDHFETVIMAVLLKRNIEELKQGICYLSFESDTWFNSSLNFAIVYEMVENPAYFDASKHVLERLKSIDTGFLPFADYLTNNFERDIGCPEYLKDNPHYDFSPLLGESKTNLLSAGHSKPCLKLNWKTRPTFASNSRMNKKSDY